MKVSLDFDLDESTFAEEILRQINKVKDVFGPSYTVRLNPGRSAPEVNNGIANPTAEVVGVPVQSGENQASLTIEPKKGATKKQGWTAERLTTLKRMVGAGKSQKEIAAALGIHTTGVSLKCKALGLTCSRPKKASPTLEVKKRKPAELEEPEGGVELGDLTGELAEYQDYVLSSLGFDDPRLSIRRRVAAWLLGDPSSREAQVAEIFGQFCDVNPQALLEQFNKLKGLSEGLLKVIATDED